MPAGTPITGYALQYKRPAESSWTDKFHSGTSTSATINGLRLGYHLPGAGAGAEFRGPQRLVFPWPGAHPQPRRPERPYARPHAGAYPVAHAGTYARANPGGNTGAHAAAGHSRAYAGSYRRAYAGSYAGTYAAAHVWANAGSHAAAGG